jgi:hypothetical protein
LARVESGKTYFFRAKNFKIRHKYVYIGGTERTNQTKEPPPFNLTIIKGNLHILGSRPFIEFALNDKRALALLEWLNDTMIPDESFFSTLNYNHELRAPGAYLGR